jgi:UDP-N-acetylglucosamine 2-epimerase
VILAGTDQDVIFNEVSRLIDNETHYQTMSLAHNPYGDGHAAERIVLHLADL